VSETRVTYHHEDDTWWAESPDVPGFSATADSLSALRTLVWEGLAFHLEQESVDLLESMAGSGVVASVVVYSEAAWLEWRWSTTAAPLASPMSYHVVATPSPQGTTPLLTRIAS
jgi:predicted RNase H-like HicB family nuclease